MGEVERSVAEVEHCLAQALEAVGPKAIDWVRRAARAAALVKLLAPRSKAAKQVADAVEKASKAVKSYDWRR